MSGDIRIVWDNVTGTGADWAYCNGDLATGFDLETSVILSLFTDARLPDDLTVPDGTNDRRGVWLNTYTLFPPGSLLWTLNRAKLGNQTTILLQAKTYCQQALQWLLTAGIVESVTIKTFWITTSAIGIIVQVKEPQQSSATTFQYSYAWGTVAGLSQPAAYGF